MLNSTKTWQDAFNDIFGENHHKICIGKNCECHKVIKQFISDLRKRDMEALIMILNGAWSVELKIDDVVKLIKNYYTN